MKKVDISKPTTKAENYTRIMTNLKRIQALADQTAVHRKKFEFALSQLRKFSQLYSQTADSTPLTEAEITASNDFTSLLQEFRSIIVQNLLQTWTIPTIENPASTILDQLQDVFTRIHRVVLVMNNEASLEINPDSPEWLQYHVLDLRAIHASFAQYKKLKDFDPLLARTIDQRLISIDAVLSENTPDNFAPRTFSPIPVHYQTWRVSITDFEEVKPIGTGVSATVFFGRDKRNGQEVAIKKFKFQKMNGSKLQSFQREVAVLATAIHPAVLRLIGATESMPFCIITEWMPNGSLYHDLHVHHRLDQTQKTIAAFDIARGMQFLHSCQIVHRDLKSLNVLLDHNNRIRICDFGFSRHASDSSLMTQNIGTPHWMAPEILSTSSNYTSKIDVYAYGIVLWELATGQTPYSGMDSHYIINQVLSNDTRPLMPQDVNPQMKDLITQCWDRNPDVRPSFDEIVKKFETENVMMNGANREEFLKYIRESETTSEMQTRMVEEIINSAIKGEISLKNAVKRLKEVQIPPDSFEVAWNKQLIDNNTNKPQDVADYVSLFLKTSKLAEVASILRKLPRKSIPVDTISQFVEEMPTGSVEIDTDIAVAGCRNGIHDLVALYSAKPDDTILALNVCSHEGVDLRLRAAVVDRCVQSLVLNNTELASSALRCLLSIGELKRIQFDSLSSFITSADIALCSCAYLAITAMTFDQKFPPEDIFYLMLQKFEVDHRAAVAVAASCKNPKLAEIFLQTIEEKPLGTEDCLKTLISAAYNVELRPRIKEVMNKCNFEEAQPSILNFVEKLNAILL
ncbi:TKL family protein kinase [Tritrichomonas foetus]|uniref:TKL family protein kinase n=1 Tax=Tritrichomonas foetus TaxID=1144522 RepID=A0A1J4JVR9_9EUKA|nr:TKL family protein kinase [Tritrichomonas foetus]|eukprot:OHT02802.1 TKL family protein kinase [Tritrichomonas foetus]